MHARGMLDLETLTRLINDGEIETVITAFPDLYGRLLGKRIVGRFYLDEIAADGMHACNYLLACDMEMEPTPGYAFTSWDTGYGDMRAVPDHSTLRRAAWLDRTAIVICDALEEERDEPIAVSPRNILRRQVERASERGFVPYMGSELEFFLFRETYRSAREKGYANLELRQHYNEDYHLLSGGMAEDIVGAIRHGADASGIPVEFSKGEASPSQHEVNLRYAGAMEMADRHVIYKMAAKEIASSRDAAITFMAKWHAAHAGNSLHIHMSFTDPEGKSVFADAAEQGEPIPGTRAYPSDTFRFAVGGLLAHTRSLSLLFAPNVNSYKRYMEGTFAPTRIAWSYDNRTVGFRVVGHGASLRIECRIPGGDANPYLAYAGMIAAALDGIEKQTDPGPLFVGDGYTAEALPRIPNSLNEAIVAFESNPLMRAALGEEVVEHLLHFARSEQQIFDKAVTDYERARYFERI
ncbi:MAG: glutamine synthetase [Myxococcales bacterium]|nr:glutamine synthetase [Myxococcales bacterium]